jgi:ADP-ribosylglycohydrolase
VIGAIIGDVIGSVFENENIRTTNFNLFSRFSRFTDDTVLTVAVADAILSRTTHPIQWLENRHNLERYALKLKVYGKRFPNVGYGEMFSRWISSSSLRGYGSYGNGSAMRVAPIGFAFESLDEVLREARLSAIVTHNHTEAIKGAQAIASSVFLACQGQSKMAIRNFVQSKFGYDFSKNIDEIRPTYTFDSSCKGSVPQAIMAFLESTDFESAIRLAISLGGDSDTIACMTGAIAHAYYKEIPSAIWNETKLRLDSSLKQLIQEFGRHYELFV